MSVQSIDPPAAVLPVWRSSWTLLLVIAAVGLLSLWPFWDGLHQLWVWWQTSPEEDFSVLIPPVAAFLVWQQRDRLERIPFTGSWWGLWVILLGGVMLFLGQLGTILSLVQYAYVITLYGLALSFLGCTYSIFFGHSLYSRLVEMLAGKAFDPRERHVAKRRTFAVCLSVRKGIWNAGK